MNGLTSFLAAILLGILGGLLLYTLVLLICRRIDRDGPP